jgi:membrane protease YdiL (CAAX protease family)
LSRKALGQQAGNTLSRLSVSRLAPLGSSRRDVWFVIVLTALLWAVVHLQYDPYVIAQVLAYGLVFGWFRWVTGSTILTMLLHGLINFEGMLETFVALHA